ncbi:MULTISPECIES: DUF3800 domain-containing protein [unclassified Leucobacter]|uniref:DUF3800 domain-containing protein n=1 Tax=unclassified Leucobacter TaxID=2621730 RepID=UPI00165D85EE|nr:MULTISPECIES: DUF3800 domain-containing protein [unclassified Leucobacter]MBC9936938.1 DUF3800 domain-containing protein [Leucobacter sp. cx-87]
MPPLPSTVEPLVVACDESGNDGENNLNGNSAVFVHASTSVSIDVAQALMDEVRWRTRSQSAELKSKTLLQAKHQGTALWLLEHPELVGKCSLNFVHKQFFVVSKLFDATAEELAHSLGEDMYAGGGALAGATILFFMAPQAFGEAWFEALNSFERFLRASSADVASEYLDELATTLVRILMSTDSPVRDVLGPVLAGIAHLKSLSRLQLGDGIEERMRTADPLICAVGGAVHEWKIASGRPVRMVHDDAKTLTPARVQWIKESLAHPEWVADSMAHSDVNLVDIELVDSRTDPRVQVADLLAGLGRLVGEDLVAGGEPHPLLEQIGVMQSRFSVWPVAEHMKVDAARATMDESRQLHVESDSTRSEA